MRLTRGGDQPHHRAFGVRRDLSFLTPQSNQIVGYNYRTLSVANRASSHTDIRTTEGSYVEDLGLPETKVKSQVLHG